MSRFNAMKFFPLALAVYGLCGCTTINPKIAADLSLDSLKIESHLPFDVPHNPEKFAKCMAPLTIHTSAAIDTLLKNKNSKIHSATRKLNDFIAQEADRSQLADIKTRILEFQGDLDFVKGDKDTKQKADLRNSIDALKKKSKTDLAKIRSRLDNSSGRTVLYFTSYFDKAADSQSLLALPGNGTSRIAPVLARVLHKNPDDPAIDKALNDLLPKLETVLQSAIDKSKTDLATELAKAIQKKPGDPNTSKALDDLAAELSTGMQLALRSSSDSTGFIGREGTVYAFPGVVAANGSAKIDHNQIGADAIRILLESLRDSFAPLPVLSTSTATKWNFAGCNQQTDCNPKNSPSVTFKSKDETVLVDWQVFPMADGQLGITDRDTENSGPPIPVNTKTFQDIEAKARDIESATATAVGKLIRGSGNMGANEALARAGETAAGVLARHVAERWGWCTLYSNAADVLSQN